MKQRYRLGLLTIGVLTFAGCEVGPNYHTPDLQLPDQFDTGLTLLPTTIKVTAPTTAASTTQPTVPTTHPVVLKTKPAAPVNIQKWWESFDDPELNSLIARAVASNDDLEMAIARLQQARAGLSSVDVGELPVFDFSAAAGRGSGTNSTKGRIEAPLNAGSNTTGLKEITDVAGFDAGWEIDFWGQIARNIEAARADAQAAEEYRKYVLVSVVADTARSYAELRALQIRLKITQANVAAAQRTVDLTRALLKHDLGNELNVVLAERQLSASLARVAPLAADVRTAERRIAVLTGEYPQALYDELDKSASVPALPEGFDIGVPMQMIRRRPDVHEAERQLAAATARIGVATSNLFPQVALTAGAGLQNQGLGRNPVDTDFLWSVGPSLRLPILDFGQLDALIQVQDYRTRELLYRYRRTVLDAVEEVEDALNNYDAERNRLQQLQVAIASSERAVNLATQRFNLGLADFLNVLDAQRQLYDLQDQLAVSQQAVTTNLIALFKSLGGGWEGFGTIAPPPPAQPAIVAAVREIGRKLSPNGSKE